MLEGCLLLLLRGVLLLLIHGRCKHRVAVVLLLWLSANSVLLVLWVRNTLAAVALTLTAAATDVVVVAGVVVVVWRAVQRVVPPI